MKVENIENNELTLENLLKENYLSWSLILIALFIINPTNYLKAIVTYLIILLLSYFTHLISHLEYNIFGVLHYYHHTHDNFFSHFIQYVIELGFPVLFLPVYYIFGTIFLDEWVILFSALLYSSVHNINYGYFHVNDVHSLHHTDCLTNIGPDLCDVFFGTKNQSNKSVENTNHYIPNIIVTTILVVVLKQLYATHRIVLNKLLILFLTSCAIIYVTCTLVVYFFMNDDFERAFSRF